MASGQWIVDRKSRKAKWYAVVPVALASRLFVAALAVNAIDWLAENSGLHGNWMLTRFAFGLALGATGALFVTSARTSQNPKFSLRSASL